MKGYNGFQILLRVTVAIVALSSIIASYSLYKTPSNNDTGGVLLLVSVIATILVILESLLFRNSTKKYIAKMSSLISKTEKESLIFFPGAVVIIDDQNTIVWYNKMFGNQVYTEYEAYGIRITDILNIDLDKTFNSEGDLVCLNKRFYITKGIHNTSDDTLSMIHFQDTTDYVELEYDNRMSRKSVIVIFIDNYQDIMTNIRESEKAHASVEIEKLIENFVDGTTAFSKKISSDKFYVIMEERHLEPLIKNRFKILENARTITVGDRQNITLSIGVGHNSNNLAESETFAKQALEMCLGRGGDQAAVKNDNGYEFFGGVSNGVEKHTKVKTRMVANALLEVINAHDKIFVMGHKFGDLDSIGSATGMCSAVRKMGKESYVVVDEEKCLATSLITYIRDHDINNYFISTDEAYDKFDMSTLLIIVDTHNPDLVESKQILNVAEQIVIIDHHRLMVNSIDNSIMFYHEPMASSASEMVAEIIEYFGNDATISSPIANALLSGIMLDTKNFVMKTGVRTFEAAAFLKKMGADTIDVKKLFANSIETYHQKSHLINSAEIYHKCAIALTYQTFDNIRIASSQAADEMLGIIGVNASFVIYEDNGKINISARSMGIFNVQIIMESMGGGGHLTMAATQIDSTVDEAKKQLLEAIDDYIRNNT